MAVQSLTIACSSTPTAVAGTFTAPTVSHGHIRVVLKSIAGTCYLGDSGITTAGFPLSSGDSPVVHYVYQGETLWVASSSGATATLGVLRGNETT